MLHRRARRFQVVLVDAGTPGDHDRARERVLTLLRGVLASNENQPTNRLGGAPPAFSPTAAPGCHLIKE